MASKVFGLGVVWFFIASFTVWGVWEEFLSLKHAAVFWFFGGIVTAFLLVVIEHGRD